MTLSEIVMSFEIGIIYGIVALGVYFTFRVIDFPDLTCDGSFVLGAAISGILIKIGLNSWLSLFFAMFGGAVAGVITAVLYIRFNVTNLLSGILTTFMLYSINLRIMGNIPNISIVDDSTIFSGYSIIFLLFVFGIMFCTIVVLLFLTNFGLALRSLGQNKILAQNSGINVNLMTTICLAISNALIAFGGALFSQHQGFVDIGAGVGSVIIGFASIIIGEKIFSGRSIFYKITSCFIGSIIYRLLISFALHGDYFGFSTSDLNLITGVMVVVIMYFSRAKTC